MTPWIIAGISAASAYLIGSTPCGVISSRLLATVDPRLMGSGNIGATNVLMVGGKGAALLTLAGDMAKGWIPVMVARSLFTHDLLVLTVGLSTILGHLFPLYLKFRGGKGVATSFGVLLGLSPLTAAITFIAWLIPVLIWRYASVGALVASSLLPVILLGVEKKPDYVLFGTAVTLLVYLRHRENIARLIHGQEKGI